MALRLLVRRDERRDVGWAFAFLVVFVASHAVLETARDALFLASLPASRLPLTYLGVAALGVVLVRVDRLLGAATASRRLAAFTALSSIGTFVALALLPIGGRLALYLLYGWPSVVTALVLVHFWSLLGDLFTVTQAKRIFGVIGAGSTVGALVGTGLAALLAERVSASALVAVAGAGLALSAALPVFALRMQGASQVERESVGLADALGFVVWQPYARQLVLFGVLGAVTLTLADYVFKAEVALHVAGADLARVFARSYLLLNALSLVAQLLVTAPLVRRFSPPIAAALLPILLAASGLGVFVTSTVAAALVMKGFDGALRYSVHRTVLELLFVPLADQARRAAKSLLEVVGQRLGQVVASLLVLGLVALGADEAVLGGVMALVATAWMVVAVRLRQPYVDMFRDHVLTGLRPTLAAYPSLDVASLETLVSALDSDVDEEVLAALVILEREKRERLVPTLLLYHPSREVVVTTLRMFARTRRRKALGAIERLIEHASPRVRAEAYVARAALTADAGWLERQLESELHDEARAALVAVLAARGVWSEDESRARIEELAAHPDPGTRAVVSEVLGLTGATAYVPLLTDLARAAEPEVREAAVQGLGALATPAAIHALVGLLGDDTARRAAKRALVASGDAGRSALVEALEDDALPRGLRWELPGVLASGWPDFAIDVLPARLRAEGDGMVRFRILVALQAIVDQEPDLRVERRLVDREIEVNVSRAYRYLRRRVVLTRAAAARPELSTRGHQLLVDLLRDKEHNATGRVFRLLALRHPTQPFAGIYRSLESGERVQRAQAVELVDVLLTGDVRLAVVGLVEDVEDDASRLAAAGRFLGPHADDYEALVEELLGSRSAIVRDAAAYHVGELRLASARGALERLVEEGRGSSDVELALSLIDGAPSQRFVALPPRAGEVMHAG